MRRSVVAAALAAGALAAGPALGVSGAAAERPTGAGDGCPPAGGFVTYFPESIEYRVRVVLSGCSWYDGNPAFLRGSLVRTDPLADDRVDLVVRCEPGAANPPRRRPPPPFRPGPPLPPLPAPPLPAPHHEFRPTEARQAAGATGEPDEVWSAGDCVLSLRMEHLPVERARYDGELHYPGPDGDKVERISIMCTSAIEVSGCEPAG
ncbi:MAG: hypothetical protein ACRDY7_14760 [Acidimicrobiia bacterium]